MSRGLLCKGTLLLIYFAAGLEAQESLAYFDAPVAVLDEVADPFSHLMYYNANAQLDALGDWTTLFNDRYISVYSGMADGTFDYRHRVLFGDPDSPVGDPAPLFLASAYLDTDARQDFVAAAGTSLRVYISNSSGPILDHSERLGEFILGVAAANLDATGTGEFAVLDEDSLAVYSYSGTSWSVADSVSLPGLGDDSMLRAGDLHGSRSAGLVHSTSSSVDLYSFDGVQLVLQASLAHSTADPKLTLGDVDGNGLSDVVLFGASDYQIVRQTALGNFVVEAPLTGGPATDLFDVDGDGDLDGLCCGGGGQVPNHDDPSLFHISLNDGSGGFSIAYTLPSLGARQLAGAADLDSDGDVDLVAGRTIYYGDDYGKPLAPSSGPFLPLAGGVLDADSDGDLDAEISLDSVALNAGDGSLSCTSLGRSTDPAGGTLVGPGLPGDFDGDGDTDLVVELVNGGCFVQMQLLRNNGCGFYEDAGAAAAPGVQFMVEGADPYYAVIADANHDGDIDILSKTEVNPGSILWANDGSGHFTSSYDLRVWAHWALEVADLTGDGIPDILSHGPGSFLVHPSHGDGTFASPIIATPGPVGARFTGLIAFDGIHDKLAIGDFNNDGYNDLMAIEKSDAFDRTLYYLRNLGPSAPGTFTWTALDTSFYPTFQNHPSQIESGGTNPRRVFAEDVDADGDLDLLVWPVRAGGNSMLVVENSGPPPSQWTVSALQMVQSRAFADLDGDGWRDAVGSRFWRHRALDRGEAGERSQYGQGSPAAGGFTPQLGASGPFRVGENAALHFNGAAGQSAALVAVSLVADEVPDSPHLGSTSYLGPWAFFRLVFTGGSAAEAGTGSFLFPYTIPPAVQDVELYHQVICTDPETYLASSNGLRLLYR